MAETEEKITHAMRALVAKSRPDLHPRADDLVAYSAGELPSDAQDQLRLHLSLCEECAQAVLDMTSFPDLELRADFARTAQEETKEKKRLRARIRDEAHPQRRALWAVAACLVVIVGLAGWVAALRDGVVEGPVVASNVLVKVLYPDGLSRTRDFSQTERTEVGPGVNRVLWVLYADFSQRYPAYEADFVDVREELIWRGAVDFVTDESFTILVRPETLQPGTYSIRVFGLLDGERIHEGTYQTEVLRR